tara:strand:- start:942 stop:1469 length:528 start_codon:yes stop_codon:yes gene_type:complete
MTIKTIFLDRDGVINKEKNYLYKIKEFEFIDGVFRACKFFKELDYKIIVITNQSGISRNYYTENDFKSLNSWMITQFKKNDIDILDVFHCPHGPKSNCTCRKPKPGMLLKAQIKYNIDMKNSWMIGDHEIDIIAANNAGISNTVLVRSGHLIDESTSNARYILDSIDQSRQVIIN